MLNEILDPYIKCKNSFVSLLPSRINDKLCGWGPLTRERLLCYVFFFLISCDITKYSEITGSKFFLKFE